jgi:hypothetical protein
MAEQSQHKQMYLPIRIGKNMLLVGMMRIQKFYKKQEHEMEF